MLSIRVLKFRRWFSSIMAVRNCFQIITMCIEVAYQTVKFVRLIRKEPKNIIRVLIIHNYNYCGASAT